MALVNAAVKNSHEISLQDMNKSENKVVSLILLGSSENTQGNLIPANYFPTWRL